MDTIKRNDLLVKGDKVVVGLSGGPDSLAMMHALIRQQEILGISLTAVHINHRFRGLLADADEAFVISFCNEYHIPCYSFSEDVTALSKDLGVSFEEAGRIIRYQKFEQVKIETGSHKIAIAQNRNDVVETFFINLFRGSGVDGLASIEYKRDGYYIRPLLDVDRQSIEAYCIQQNLEPRRDHTNDENDYVRNKIRNEFLPYIRNEFNESIDDAVQRTVAIMKGEKTFWSIHVEKLFEEMCRIKSGEIYLQYDMFRALQDAEKYQLIRLCVKKLKGNMTNVSYETIIRISTLSRTGTVCEIDKDLIATKSYEDIIFSSRAGTEKVDNYQLPMLNTKIIDASERNRYELSQSCIAVDADQIKGALYVRTRKDGDRFIPLGMKGHKKLKAFFIDEKIPSSKRNSVLLVCDDEKIIWVQDLRMSETCKITENTKNIMIMSFQELVERH